MAQFKRQARMSYMLEQLFFSFALLENNLVPFSLYVLTLLTNFENKIFTILLLIHSRKHMYHFLFF